MHPFWASLFQVTLAKVYVLFLYVTKPDYRYFITWFLTLCVPCSWLWPCLTYVDTVLPVWLVPPYPLLFSDVFGLFSAPTTLPTIFASVFNNLSSKFSDIFVNKPPDLASNYQASAFWQCGHGFYPELTFNNHL